MTDFLELARHCEEIEGPAWELDVAISKVAGWPDAIPPGKFTCSLDAAMTLVPEGYRVTCLGESIVECPRPWRAILWERKRAPNRPYGDGATAALALCAAALRARTRS